MALEKTLDRPVFPIDDVLMELTAALSANSSAVLVAPPGAGKTTVVPLALLDANWLAGQRILVLEPRRIAARAAASRMASFLGESVGGTVGMRARLATKVSPATRIEVVTEGVFTRMIIDDPSLDGVGAVIFDEFHERSLDSDFGLALALDAQSGLREDLRLLVMSATIDGAGVASLLGDVPVIASDGRAYPVDTRYLGRENQRPIEMQVADAVCKALSEEAGSVLAFLPGQAEIRRTAEKLKGVVTDPSIDIAPLYGAMDARAQDDAIRPSSRGQRKVVLATAIAETSLTIEGVRIVIDSGLARVPRFDVGARMTRLDTVRVSRASAEQRRGRAGRTEPGVCYRLWHEAETQGLRPFETPEIHNADLTSLVLDCCAWGVRDPSQLTWLEPPPKGALEAAFENLGRLGAITSDGRINAHGEALRRLPMPAHLAAMVLAAAKVGQAQEAAELAGLLVERGLGGTSSDLEYRLRAFRNDRSRRAQQVRSLTRRWGQAAMDLAGEPSGETFKYSVAGLLSVAFPDRIARRRGRDGQLLMSGGRGARLSDDDPLRDAEYLVIGELQGTAASARVLAAARFDERELVAFAGERIVSREEIVFDRLSGAVRASRVRKLGAITLSQSPSVVATDDGRVAAELGRGIISELGIGRLPWSKSLMQMRARVGFLRQTDDVWPDLSDAALAEDWENWLAPFLAGKTSLSDISIADLAAALDALIPWDLRRRLEQAAPTHFEAPTGSRHAISYDGENAPGVALRVQELFGLTEHPTIADGRLPLTLTLLSPAQRPIQVTKDLPGFWAGSWRDVKAEMKGRYPKHVWPDDPASAVATTRAKPRAR